MRKDVLEEYLEAEFHEYLYKADFAHCERLLNEAVEYGINVQELEMELAAWNPNITVEEPTYE